MTIDFKIQNLENHKELFDIAEELELLADEMRYNFNCISTKNDFRRSKMPLYKTTFLYLINNIMHQFNSIRVLCLEGYGQSALIILRSMLENLISTKYMIFLDKSMVLDEAMANMKARRFEDYCCVEMNKSLEYWKMDDEVHSKKLATEVLSKEKEVLEHFNKFKKDFNITNGKELSTWSGVGVAHMAKSVGMLGEYNSLYRTCCSFSHPSFLGTQQNVTKTEKMTNFSSKPSFEHIVVNLESSIIYFSEFLLMYDFLFKLGMIQKLKHYQNKAKSIFDMKKYVL